MTDPEPLPVCGAQHPNMPEVTCVEPPGPNAATADTIQVDDNGEPILDEEGMARIISGHPVHVHAGRSADSGWHYWEDEA